MKPTPPSERWRHKVISKHNERGKAIDKQTELNRQLRELEGNENDS